MFNKTKITVVPSGYQPDLDRLPPAKAGCGGCLWVMLFVMLLVGVGASAYYVLSSPEETSPEPQSAITLNTLVPTATATHTATMDYCWFLTPTIEAMPTIQVTLDTWQIKATDDSFLTGTPTATAFPTSEPPKVWCNDVLTMEAMPTVTLTPYGLPTDIPHLEFEATATITNTPQPITPTAVPSSTLFPTLIPQVNSLQQPAVQPQQAPVVVVQTVVVKETVVEKVKVKDKVTVIVTATPTASEDIPEVTEEPTLVLTETATYTPTPTLTNTPTETATLTPTATATLIPTSTLFPTFIPTATDMPTETATETVTNA